MFLKLLAMLALFTWSSVALACEAPDGNPGEDVIVCIMHGGEERSYVLHLPTNYDGETPLPLLFGVHGYTGSGLTFENEQMVIFDHINEHNYIGVFPSALAASSEAAWAKTWGSPVFFADTGPDGPTCEGEPWTYPAAENCSAEMLERKCNWGGSCSDDAGFFRKVIERVITSYAVDKDRVYMTSHSMGSTLMNGSLEELGDLFAAVAPVSGQAVNGYRSTSSTRLAYMQLWSRQDDYVRPDGKLGSDNLYYDSSEEIATSWAQAQGCATEGDTPYPSVSDGISGFACTQHADCRDESEVVSCSWDGDHSWPRNEEASFGFDVIWHFLNKHSKSGRLD
jgi:polyhydroxybutyrate depolymerase